MQRYMRYTIFQNVYMIHTLSGVKLAYHKTIVS
jgi:hypothetical protein